MKRFGICMLVLVLAMMALAACSPAEGAAIALNETELVISKGKSAAVQITAFPDGMNAKKAVWTSSDMSVATVKNGKIKAVACGECEITCQASEDESVRAACRVTVIQMIQNIQIKSKKITVPFGASQPIEVTYKPQDATRKELLWTSSDENVCTVDPDGTVTAVGAGDCTISCATTDGSNKTAKVTVHVPIFEKTAEAVTVETQGENLIPLDLHGVSLLNISHKASSSSCFLYQIGTDGLHIYPLAEGTATITLTSQLDKKDQMVCTVTVAKSAVFVPTEENPVQVIVVSDRSSIRIGEKVTFTYQVLGTPKKVSNVAVILTSSFGSGGGSGNPPTMQGKMSGSWTVDTKGWSRATANAVEFVVSASGERNKVYKGSCRVPISNHISISAVSEVSTAQRNTPFKVHYRIAGGVPPYNVEFMIRQGETSRANVKTNGTGEFEILPGDEDLIEFTLFIVTDSKKNKTNGGIFQMKIPVSDEEPALINMENAFKMADGAYVLSYLKNAPGTKLSVNKNRLTEEAVFIAPDADGATYTIPLGEKDSGLLLGYKMKDRTTCFAGVYIGHLKEK